LASANCCCSPSAAGITALLAVALVPFFAFREIARGVGEKEFRILMLGPANSPLARQAVPALPDSAAASA
jgi:hypothetical protein